ncbi:periplasmic binding protein-like I [Catenaria anguillulae PL171]|uniref:Periplasmic binding protein-like I n=1 Tax=Catenaria anguillulae PL171 TaxID=765915 RepID=A0A1Y2HTT0_9FUNG|nr:periplasmic binding protein-like I [Catenaria anguillulae PL171]
MLQGIDPSNQHSFQMIYTPTNYTARNATMAMLNAIINDGAVAALGDWTSSVTIPQAHAGSKWFMYMCSGGATSGQLSDKTAFPYFFRSICQDPAQGIVIAHFIKYMSWKSAALIASSDAYGQSVGNAFLTTAQTLGLSVVQNQVIQPGQTDYSIALNAILNSGSQIIVLSALSENSILLLRQARAMGMIGPEWVWIGPEAFDYWMDLQINAEDVKNVQGMLYVYPQEKTFNALFNASLARYNAAYPNEPSPPSYSYLFLGMELHDCHGQGHPSTCPRCEPRRHLCS